MTVAGADYFPDAWKNSYVESGLMCSEWRRKGTILRGEIGPVLALLSAHDTLSGNRRVLRSHAVLRRRRE